MKNKQKGFVIPLIIIIVLLIISGGTYIYIKKSLNSNMIETTSTSTPTIACTKDAKLCPDGSSVGRTGPNCEFTLCPSSGTSEIKTDFGKSIVMHINDKVIFPNSLSLILKEINDSRCKPGLECFWQGEFSALFKVNINGSLEEIRLGTVNNKKVSLKGHTFSLESATENSVTISVSINLVSSNKSGISGYVHMGPICPVEKYPPDPNCADKPFANAIIDIMVKSSNTLISSVKSDTNGNFNVAFLPETYVIKVSSQSNGILPRCEEKEVIVTINKFTSLDISCDTGIR